ncbi:hypothetical protein [Enterobacter cloacae]|uniref:hypothetical protein n=1 Tax=Enterobacter cloacae TaxID=550 RepID=UPI003D1C457B
MNDFRRLAAKIDQHMQQLAAQNIRETHAIINHMMGYVPDLHKIWVGTSDQQFMGVVSRISWVLPLRPHHGGSLRSRAQQDIATL